MNPKKCGEVDSFPFEGMHICSSEILERVQIGGREPCPRCHKSRKYFCYSCCVPIPTLEGHIPQVKLQLRIDIIKHKNEIDGKSTAIHGAILAPEDIKIYTYPDIPDYSKEDRVFLIYPSRTSMEISCLFENNINSLRNLNEMENKKDSHLGTLLKKRFVSENKERKCFNIKNINDLPIRKAIFIDSTWNQSRGIYKDERIKQLPCVVLQNRVSQFWRYQKGSPRWYLATIEAVHQFLLEVHLNAWGVNPNYKGPHCDEFRNEYNSCELNDEMYNGQYDNVLFFFSHMYTEIHKLYDHDKLEAYKRPMT